MSSSRSTSTSTVARSTSTSTVPPRTHAATAARRRRAMSRKILDIRIRIRDLDRLELLVLTCDLWAEIEQRGLVLEFEDLMDRLHGPLE